MNNLTQRIITASILAFILIFSIFKLPPQVFIFIMFVAVAIGLFEFFKLLNIKSLFFKMAISILFSVVLFFEFSSLVVGLPPVISIFSVVFWIYNLFLVTQYPRFKPLKNKVIQVSKAYLLFAPVLLVFIAMTVFSDMKIMILWLFGIVWGADVFAYFSGKKFGKTKLVPKLSGGKTVEGVVGGLIGVIIVSIVFLSIQEIALVDYPKYLLLALITGIFSVVGDLYESIYKREAGVKDSGNILPGHGGILDRIDSLLAATPIFFVGLMAIQ